MPAIKGVRRRWEEIISALERRASANMRLKRLVLKGSRVEKGESGEINASALRRAAELVEEVVDDRISTSL